MLALLAARVGPRRLLDRSAGPQLAAPSPPAAPPTPPAPLPGLGVQLGAHALDLARLCARLRRPLLAAPPRRGHSSLHAAALAAAALALTAAPLAPAAGPLALPAPPPAPPATPALALALRLGLADRAARTRHDPNLVGPGTKPEEPARALLQDGDHHFRARPAECCQTLLDGVVQRATFECGLIVPHGEPLMPRRAQRTRECHAPRIV